MSQPKPNQLDDERSRRWEVEAAFFDDRAANDIEQVTAVDPDTLCATMTETTTSTFITVEGKEVKDEIWYGDQVKYDHALSFCREFFAWYNDEHYHSGIGLLTPSIVHYGKAAEVQESRELVLASAYAKHPQRFVKGLPKAPRLPSAVWINPPMATESKESAQQKRLPETHCPQKPDAPLTHPRLGYPLSSCVPAELDSVSPSASQDTSLNYLEQPLNTRVMPQKIPGGLGDWSPRELPTELSTLRTLH